jgi:transcriptional regulator with XRE-family HTH domain
MSNPMHDPRYEIFRSLLVEIRERGKFTQVDVANRLHKPQSYISKYERGERRLDVIEMLDIAEALEVNPNHILRDLIIKLE